MNLRPARVATEIDAAMDLIQRHECASHNFQLHEFLPLILMRAPLLRRLPLAVNVSSVQITPSNFRLSISAAEYPISLKTSAVCSA